MQNIDIHANISYTPFDIRNYNWIPFSDEWGDDCKRGTTEWENKCLETVNEFFTKLFSVPGFMEFFIENNCRVKLATMQSFLSQKNYKLSFPKSREFYEPFGWHWCQCKGGRNAPGHLQWNNGWLYDKLSAPSITVTVDEKEYHPFSDSINCFYGACEDNDEFAWRICEASSYNIPYLYAILNSYDHDMNNLYEQGFTAQEYEPLYAVMKFFESILPIYNVIVDEDTPTTGTGIYEMHIINMNNANLRELVRKHKKTIKSIVGQCSE